MSAKGKLSFDGCVELVGQIVDDFITFSEEPKPNIPSKKVYKVTSSEEAPDVVRSARRAALSNIKDSLFLEKFAFDTRRIDQKFERNPRINLQYWNRSQQFIDAEKHKNMVTFGKLIDPLNDIQDQYGDQPEYFQSYAMDLHDLVGRVLRVKEADLEVFTPQLDYLKQLLYARYRLSMEDIERLSRDQLKERILSKDEALLKRGNYLKTTNTKENNNKPTAVVKDGDGGVTQESIINAIFGNSKFRRDGEKKAQRTITIIIKDEAIDE